MRILVTGSHGAVGSALVPELVRSGHDVVRLVRHQPATGEIVWDPVALKIRAEDLEGFDGVVHLASAPHQGRWTARFKREMVASRIGPTRLLSEALSSLKQRPSVMVCASGMGYYPDCGDQAITEDAPVGLGFAAEFNRDGEAAAAPAVAVGIRTVHLRTSIVLSRDSGALHSLLGSFKRGLGGRQGSGRQFWSWVARSEMPGIIMHALTHPDLKGAVNATSPNPIRNEDFAKTLGKVLGQSARRATPSWLLRLVLGEMADTLLFASRRIVPEKLLASSYKFRYPDLESAFRHELGLQEPALS